MAVHAGTSRVRRSLITVAVAAATVTSVGSAAADPRVGGDIGVRYESLGGPAGFLGDPVGGEVGTPNGRGAYVTFQGGSIYWAPASGAREVHGAIRSEWARTGWENGPLGFPLTDEVRTPNGLGSYNAFQGGNIYFSPSTGAHEVHGDIRKAYQWAGWEGGILGFPTSGEVPTSDGRGAHTTFQAGSIYWSAQTGANVLVGAIRDAWAAQGRENGTLAFPTSSEFDIPGGKRVNFQGGYIEWSPATGALVNRTIAAPVAPPVVVAPLPPVQPTPPAGVYYANCAAVRAAGAAPLYRGEPGYRPGLDRDGDGVACE